jgi:hypothetical protein
MKEAHISDTVHYVHNPGSGQHTRCVAAIVTDVADPLRGYLTVREMAELQLRRTRHSLEGEMYTWHWKFECPREKERGRNE